MPISDKMLEAIFSLPLEVIWLTTWEERANSALGAQLGLPPLPYLPLPGGRRWSKRTAVRQWVAANPLRPVISADDDRRIRLCPKWLRGLQPNSLIINPRKAVGVTPADVDLMSDFLEHLT